MMPRWRVDLMGKKLQHVGTVEAANEKAAIEIAIKELRIDPVLRFKLMVTKVKE
jgi:hypothetical protein